MADKPKQRIKTVYFPGADAGSEGRAKGVVSIAFSMTDGSQRELYERFVRHLGSAEIRRVLGAETWTELIRDDHDSATLRERLQHEYESYKEGKGRVARLLQGRLLPDTPRATHDPASPLFDTVVSGTEDPIWRPERYLRELVPRATRVLDPFAGTGNFAIAAWRHGVVSWYCEIDPVAREIARLKIDILSRSSRGLYLLRQQLEEVADACGSLLGDEVGAFHEAPRREDGEGAAALPRGTLASALAARNVASELLRESPLVGRCYALAAASAAGARVDGAATAMLDARGVDSEFRNALVDWLYGWVRLIGDEVLRREDARGARTAGAARPVLASADARELAWIEPIGVDAVITALPPFTVVDVPTTKERVRAWMLGGTGPGASARRRADAVGGLGSLRGHPYRDLTPAEVKAVVDGDDVDLAPKIVSGSDCRAARMVLSSFLFRDEIGRIAATSRRAATAAVRYFVLLAQVADALRVTRAAKCTIVLEVRTTWVGDHEVDTPKLVSAIMKATGVRRVRKETIERRLSRASSSVARKEIRRDLLVFSAA